MPPKTSCLYVLKHICCNVRRNTVQNYSFLNDPTFSPKMKLLSTFTFYLDKTTVYNKLVVILHTIYEEFLKLQESVKQRRKKPQINPISFAFRQIGEKSRDFWFEFLKYLKKQLI